MKTGLQYFQWHNGDKILENGVSYHNPRTCRDFVLIWMENNKYTMLSIDSGRLNKNIPMAQGDKEGNIMFLEKELKEKFNADEWFVLNKHLDIVKIPEE